MISGSVYSVKIGGMAGQGVKSSGFTFSKFAVRSGYNIYNYIEYPSLIKGGHNVMQINISDKDVTGPRISTDFLIALNQETINFHINELNSESGVLYDSEKKLDTSIVINKCHLFPVPLSKLAKDAGGKDLLSNTVAVAATIAVLGGDIAIFKTLLEEEFNDKGPEVVKINHLAADLGYNYVLENFASKVSSTLTKVDSKVSKMVLNGDDAVALGAIAAGLQFASIYPMSPISNILHALALHQKEYDYIYKQPEDEISAITMAIGASFAGARAMTATSGGGFCLMTEGYGLAGMTETPIVIVEGMRGSPATGLPTWSEQGDLRFVLHAHQGEIPRFVLAAGDVTEAFFMIMEAFYIADKYQAPVVLLIDKNICDHEQSVPIFDVSSYRVDRGKFVNTPSPEYKRYALSADGISPRTIPGVGNFFIANSDEHDEYGYSIEDINNRNNQMSKRMSKLETCAKNDMPEPTVYGPKDADLTIVSWGSNKGSILQALKKYPNVNYIHFTWFNPFPTEFVTKFLGNSKKLLNVECNYNGQLAGLIREKTGINIDNMLLKNDGRPFYVEELEEKIGMYLKGEK